MKSFLTSLPLLRIAPFLFAISTVLPIKAQTDDCLMQGSEPMQAEPLQSIISSLAGIDFFQEDNCESLYLKCNFIFLRKDDGSGSFPENDPKIQDVIDGINYWWSSISDPQDCATSEPYPFDSKMRVKVDIHYINNTDAWDWYAQAVSLGSNYPSSGTGFCPDDVEATNSTWPALKSVVQSFNSNHPGELNFFFVENGTQLEAIEEAVNTQNTSNIPWDDPYNFKIFSGCSELPASYNSSEDQWILMVNQWTGYYTRINFGTLYYPQYAQEGNEVIASWHLDGIPKLANHEVGHTVLNQFHTCGCLNLMIGGSCNPGWNPSANYLTKTQLNTLQLTLMTSNLHNLVDCEELSEDNCDIVVFDDATVSAPMSVFGDIIVEPGVVLTITSEVYLSKDSRIDLKENAKLIVDGGTLTSGCDDTWIGIKVTGGNKDFDVKFLDATIENTSSAAVSMFAPLPWPDIQQYGNGIIKADNTTFNNTSRIVEMMAWSPSYNPSYFRDCFQYGGKWSITNWNCYGVEISDCEFHDITESAIVTEVGQFIIDGNKFYSSKNDILFANVFPGFGTIINDNESYSNHTGVRALGTTIAQNRITRNEFNSGIFNIFMDGDNNYWIENNNLTANFGSVSLNNGNHSNEVTTNDINGCSVGLIITGYNKGFNFKKNCFDTDFVDSHIYGQVAPVISDGISNPANNCFTHQGNVNSFINDIAGNPNPFKYVEPNDHSNTCLDALKAHANVTRVFQGNTDDVCSYAGADFTTGGNDNCNQAMNESALLGTISSLNSSISSVQSNSSLTAATKDWYIMSYKRCLKRATWTLFEYYLREKEFSNARSLLSSDTTEDARIATFASYIFENELEDAGTYLSSLTSTGSAFNDFKWIQNVNLSRLPYGPFFSINAQNLDTIEIIANKTHIYAGYAKALYYHLTGELLSSEIPEDLEEYLEPRSVESDDDFKEIKITPNPFSNVLHITSTGYENNLSVCIYDMLGRPIYKDQIGSDDVVYTESWNPGLYVVLIIADNKVIEQKKLMHLK